MPYWRTGVHAQTGVPLKTEYCIAGPTPYIERWRQNSGSIKDVALLGKAKRRKE